MSTRCANIKNGENWTVQLNQIVQCCMLHLVLHHSALSRTALSMTQLPRTPLSHRILSIAKKIVKCKKLSIFFGLNNEILSRQ